MEHQKTGQFFLEYSSKLNAQLIKSFKTNECMTILNILMYVQILNYFRQKTTLIFNENKLTSFCKENDLGQLGFKIVVQCLLY